MDDIKQLLMVIQNDIKDTKDRVENSESILLRKIDEKFNHVELKIHALENTIQTQESRLDFLEKQIRYKNIVIFGVEEKERNYQDLSKIVLQIFNSIMKVNCTTLEIENIRRKGKRSNKPRPITITFTTLGRKIEILRNKKLLENFGYYIKEDYPPKVLEIRKELQEKAKMEREKGNRAYIKYDKLIILPHKEIRDQEIPRNKRNLSVTPPESQTKYIKKTQEANPTHLQKKNTIPSFWTPKQKINSKQNDSFFSPEPTTSSQRIDQEK